MLLLGNVLANGMNAGAAWSFLGMTMRLAQSLGLHRSSTTDARETATTEDNARTQLWWAVLWQDSLLSISYDRSSSAVTADCPFPPLRQPGRGYTYHEAMYRILKTGLDTIRNRVASQTIETRLVKCGDLRDAVTRARDEATDHLRDLSRCKSIVEQSEYWMLYLHASFMKSELCRPAISPSTAKFDKDSNLRQQCVDYLINTVEAFLGVANVAPVYIRSWAVTHRGLSSALLLAILGEPVRSTRAQTLLKDFIQVMTTASSSGAASELSAPIQRSVSALKKLSATESRTPKILEGGTGAAGDPIVLPTSEPTDLYAANNALLSYDESQFFIPSPLSGFEDESSPYALMDSIIFGGGRPMA